MVGSVLIGLSVVNSYRETPGPIPNPEAKPVRADGTATGRLWESKSPPTPNNKQQNSVYFERSKVTNLLVALLLFCVIPEFSILDFMRTLAQAVTRLVRSTAGFYHHTHKHSSLS